MAIWDARMEEKVKRAEDVGLGWVKPSQDPHLRVRPLQGSSLNALEVIPPGMGDRSFRLRHQTLAPPGEQEMVSPNLRSR